MKTYLLYALSLSFLVISCGGEEETPDSESNGSEESSVVATNDPVTTNDDRFKEVAESQGDEEEEVVDPTKIKYLEESHNFGNVFFPSDNLYSFKFQNVGNRPLIISSATASCGCTVPDPPKEPIAPGETGELDVIFRPKKGQVGQTVTKRITVTANTDPKETYLEITATVIDAM